MNFVTLVVEKSKGYERNTIYSICLVKYQDGEKIDNFYSLVKPPELCVQPNIALLHDSLSPDDLSNAPTIAELWSNKIKSFIGDLPISFHRDGCLDALFVNLEWFGVKLPILHYFNSYHLAMKVWPKLLRRHLPEIANLLNIPYEDNNIKDKAEFYGQMILLAAEEMECSLLDDLLGSVKVELQKKVMHSSELWRNSTDLSLENYNIQELEQLAVDFYKEYRRDKNQKKIIAEIIDDILQKRIMKLDDEIIWTEENVNKLLKANGILVSAAEKAHLYAQSMIEKLNIKKIDSDELLLNDVEIKLTPYISGYEDIEDNEDCFLHVLCEHINNKYLLVFSGGDDKYFDKSETWLEGLWDEDLKVLDCFKDKYISYAVHELWDAHWCFHDIMNIERVQIEVRIETEVGYEKYIEN